jgi:radical SAM protein with 4Fe4S-binding SPASM domain
MVMTPGMAEHQPFDRARYETFGGIVSCLEPPFLAWVDRDFMKSLGFPESRLWNADDPGFLSAPTEVHFSVTQKCSQGCEGCYQDSSFGRAADLPLAEVKSILKILRDMGVFHTALGGGEAFEREDFGEIVSYCRQVGLVPNLTTNGQNIGMQEIEICRQMGQVNVSMDGVNENYGINGRRGNFQKADKALRQLRAAGVQAGINCTVSRKNFHRIERVVSYAQELGLNEIEFLKYKPSGRGVKAYRDHALTQEMIRAFYPEIVRLSSVYGVELKIDCSFIPAMVYHRPPMADLERLAVVGCDGGNLLLGVKSNGAFSACSFVENSEDIRAISRLWDTSDHLKGFRRWTDTAPEPCISCEYLKICRGGCRAVALYLAHDMTAPDPECPFVYDYVKGRHLEKVQA